MRTMKDSGIEWIGQIPESWSVEALKRNVKIEMGQSPASECYNSDGVGFPFLQGNADFTDKFPVERMYTSAANKFSKTGDLLLSVRAPVGAVNIADKEYAIGRGLCAITGGRISIPFLWYAIAVLNHEFDANSTGSTFESINTEDVGNAKIMVPGEDEQRRIAEYLDVKCAEIDALIAAKEKTNALLKERRQSIIYEAVTKGLNPDVPMKDSGIEWIGQIPEHWGVGKLGYFIEAFNGDRSSNYPSGNDIQDSGVPFLTSSNLERDVLDMSNSKYISEEKYKSMSGLKMELDDIIYCLRGSVGKCAINKTETCGTVASSLMGIRCKKMIPDYLLFLLKSSVIETQNALFMNGTCAANLSAENVCGYLVPIPNETEQRTIAEYLQGRCSEMDELISANEATIQKLKEYRQSVIYEAVTGKIEI